MGRRSRRRQQGSASGSREPAGTTAYADPDGNVLTLRDSLSRGTLRELHKLSSSPAASQEDKWQRRGELLFERLAVGWTIAGLPLEGQKELLGRFRMASPDERRWLRDTLESHIAERHPDAAL
ncbi:MAG: hypothetical protein QOG63_2800 [Thermoleophilaceae bacterium]|nr:hypothetical protein [Thermoleophilaceae bacterium]